jgi:hypothetical protein
MNGGRARAGQGVELALGAVVTAAAALACGSSPNGPSPPRVTTALEFCEQEREQTAAFSARCLGGSAEDWRALRDSYMPCSRFDELIAAGTVTFHLDLAADCLEQQRADRDCSAPENFCFVKTLEGKLPANAPCQNDYECPANGACWAPSELALNRCGGSVCVTLGDKVGDPCVDLPACYPGVVTCFAGTCVAYLEKGDPCGFDKPRCGPGLRCDAVTTKCAPIEAGSRCGDDFDCLGTEYCDNLDCRPRIAVGASCNGAPTGCVGWASCNTQTFTCEAAGHPGQACGSTMGDDYLCIDSFCQSNGDGSRSCIAPFPLGATCSVGHQCASGGCADNVCAACPM